MQSSFTKGLISEKLFARSDVNNLTSSSASVLDNFVITQSGAITKRPGTKYLRVVPNGFKLIPFKTTYEDYLLAFDNTNIQIYRLDGTLKTTTTFYRPFTGIDINQIKYAQDNNTIIFTHNTTRPQLIIANGPTSFQSKLLPTTICPAYDFNDINYDDFWFTFLKTDFTPGGPVKIGDTVILGVFSSQSQAAAANTLSGGGGINVNIASYYESSGISGIFTGAGITISFTGSATKNDCTFLIGQLLSTDLAKLPDFGTVISGKDSFFANPAMSTLKGWPSACAYYQGRLWLGGFSGVNNLIVGSGIDKYSNFESGTAKDTDPVSFKLSSSTPARIRNITASKTMLVFTDVGEFAFIASSGTGTITGSNINIRVQTRNGITYCDPVELDDQLFYVQAGGNVVRGTDYNSGSNSYDSKNVSIFCPEIISNPISGCAIKNLNNNDNSYMLMINPNGQIACLQSVNEQNISGWSRWYSKGRGFRYAVSIDNRSFCLVYNVLSNITTLEEFSFDCYVDCQQSGTMINGVGTMDAPTNNIMVKKDDGHIYRIDNPTAVSGFNVNDKNSNGPFVAGTEIESNMTTVPISLRNEQVGDLLFIPKKISDIHIYYYNTIGINVSVNSTTSNIIPVLTYDTSNYSEPLVPKSGIYEFNTVVDWKLLSTISISHIQPYPCTILSIGLEVHV